MTTFNLDKIATIEIVEDLISFKKQIHVVKTGESFEYGFGKSHIYIHHFDDEENTSLREKTDQIIVELFPSWNADQYLEKLKRTLLPDEDPFKLLKIRIYCECPETKWCSFPIELNVSDSLEKHVVKIPVDLEDVSNKLIVETSIVRVKNANPTDSFVAIKKDSIVGTLAPIEIYIDEPTQIGSNFLPINPDDTGSLLFDIKDFEDAKINIPALQYNKDFQKYFKSDQYDSVNFALYTVIPQYIDILLKRLFFIKSLDIQDKMSQAFIVYVSDLTDVEKNQIVETLQGDDLELKVEMYSNLSIKIFREIQSFNSFSLKSMFKTLLNREENV